MADLARLPELERGTNTQSALAFFDDCAPTQVDEMLGSWRGSGLPTGHPLDGLLELYGWHGKRFDTAEVVHPLVFGDDSGLFAVNPALVPMGLVMRAGRLVRAGFATRLARGVLRAARTTRPGARLRTMEYRGSSTATMIYDALPINDHFRAVDEDTVIGAMDLRGTPQPFFFVLRRRTAADPDGRAHPLA